MKNDRLVWSSDEGDLRKKPKGTQGGSVMESELVLKVRRLTSGKGRTVIEISGLPAHDTWCKELARKLKSSLGVGGTYKNRTIEIHGEKLEQVTAFLTAQSLKWKKTGG